MNDLLYYGKENLTPPTYSSFNFFIFLSLQLTKIKNIYKIVSTYQGYVSFAHSLLYCIFGLVFFYRDYSSFLEVRNTTLDSLCELASQSLSFALLSQDSITDMFNDEIESVRLNAINSLKKMSQYLEIREDQLEIMLGVLQVSHR